MHLLRSEVKHKAVFLEPSVRVGHEAGRPVQFGQDVIEGQPLEAHVRVHGVRLRVGVPARGSHQGRGRRGLGGHVVQLGRVLSTVQGGRGPCTAPAVVAAHQAACTPTGPARRQVGAGALEAATGPA